MSDDGRYRGDHVGWSELANVTVDETSGDVLVFAGGCSLEVNRLSMINYTTMYNYVLRRILKKVLIRTIRKYRHVDVSITIESHPQLDC